MAACYFVLCDIIRRALHHYVIAGYETTAGLSITGHFPYWTTKNSNVQMVTQILIDMSKKQTNLRYFSYYCYYSIVLISSVRVFAT